MKTLILIFLSCCTLQAQIETAILASGQASAPDTQYVTGQTLTTASAPSTAWNGIKLTVGASGITVDQLCRWKIAGNNHTHTLYLLAAGGSTIASTTVDLSSGGFANAAFACAAITPQALSSGTVYWIMSDETGTGDTYYSDSNVTITHTAVTSCGTSGNCGSAYCFPTGGVCSSPVSHFGGTADAAGPVGFLYH